MWLEKREEKGGNRAVMCWLTARLQKSLVLFRFNPVAIIPASPSTLPAFLPSLEHSEQEPLGKSLSAQEKPVVFLFSAHAMPV